MIEVEDGLASLKLDGSNSVTIHLHGLKRVFTWLIK